MDESQVVDESAKEQESTQHSHVTRDRSKIFVLQSMPNSGKVSDGHCEIVQVISLRHIEFDYSQSASYLVLETKYTELLCRLFTIVLFR